MPGEASAKKHEFIGVCILIIAILLLLCLLSYNPHDSSLNALSLKLVDRQQNWQNRRIRKRFSFSDCSASLLSCCWRRFSS